MTTYSHSKLSTFEQCPLKFKYKYIESIPPEFEETIESFLGKQVHNTLEWLYNHPQREILILDQVIQHFIQSWNKDFQPEFKITKDLTVEYYFNKGIKFLINYFISNSPFKDNTIATEKKIIINLDSGGKYQLIGYIDRLVHNPETNIFEIHDYKTSNSMKSQEELEKDRQLALYSLAIRNLYPKAEDVYLIWHFLEYNQKLTSKRTLEQLEQLRQEIIRLINKIESTTDFSPSPGPLCDWCEYQNHCPYSKGAVCETKDREKFNKSNLFDYEKNNSRDAD